MSTTVNINQIMNMDHGFWSVDFYTFLPTWGNTKILGNFEVCTVKDWRTKIMVRYLGTSPDLLFLNTFHDRINVNSDKKWCVLTSYFNGPAKNKTYSPASFINSIEYLNPTNRYNSPVPFKSLKDHPEFKLFKKANNYVLK
jgi:hypothetical protein